MVYLLTGLLFVLLFGIVQGIVYLISGTTPAKEAKKQIEKIKNSQGFIRFVYDKQIQLKKMGAGVLLKDHLTVSQWYLFKALSYLSTILAVSVYTSLLYLGHVHTLISATLYTGLKPCLVLI